MLAAFADADRRRRAIGVALYVIVAGLLILLPLELRSPDVASFLGWPVDPAEPFRLVEPLRWLGHALLFVPAGALAWRARSRGRAFAIIAAIGFAAEVVQPFVGRSGSIIDFASDLVGAALGCALVHVYAHAPRLRRLFQILGSPLCAAVALAALLATVTALTLPGAHWSDWDRSYRLLIGNEETLDRPWHGRLYEIAFYDRALASAEVAAASAGDGAPDAIARFTMDPSDLAIDDNRVTELRDSSSRGFVPLLAVERGAVRPLAGGGVEVEAGAAIATAGACDRLIERLVETEAFTLVVTFEALDPETKGPARIVSISRDPFTRNLTLAQDGEELHLRVRSSVAGPNGVRPALIVSNCVRAGERQTAVAVCTARQSRLFIDGRLRGRLVLDNLEKVVREALGEHTAPGLRPGILALVWAACAFLLFGAVRGVLGRRFSAELLAGLGAAVFVTIVAFAGR